jgi:DNA polymerase III subunit alpha
MAKGTETGFTAYGEVRADYKRRTSFVTHDDCETAKRKGITNERPGRFDSAACDHYVSLHHHSTYSFLDGFALPEAHVRRCTEIGMGALALTEHGNISSHVKLEKAAVEQGVKPIFGCEVYMGQTDEHRGQHKFHLTVLAATLEGYINLMGLVTVGYQQFYYSPTVNYQDLLRFRKGLIIMSGCTGSLLACSAIGGKNIPPNAASYKRALRVAKIFQRDFGDAYYLEVQAFPELDNVKRLNVMYERISLETGIPLVGTGDVHYTKPSENEMQKILHNVRGGNKKTVEQMAMEWGYDVQLSPPTSDTYMLRRLRATGLSKRGCMQALMSTAEIAQRCTVVLPKMDMIKFPVPYPYETVQEVWLAWIKEGWQYRSISTRTNVGSYVSQLKYEMKIVEDKGFVDYFLMVSDTVKFAKNSQIPVGPARGSVAASLVAYLLRITEVDPLAFPNLLFERFIEPNRKDLPDIDLDFDDRRRHEIRQYLVSKYGEAQVGNVGTFTTYKSKLALDDVARAHRIPKYEVEIVKELLLERSSGDLRANATIEDTAVMFEAAADVFARHANLRHAIDLEGQVKGMGVHAAGLVVASGPLTNVCATYSREVKGRTVEVLSVDKYDAEYLNVLKIDVLGLTTLGMISRCLVAIGKPLDWLYEIPLDDKETLDGFQSNDVVGVFQFDGRAMRGVTAELKPINFLEVCDITALARPGPLHNGAAAEYIDVKNGTKAARQYHPLVDDIVKSTHGQIVYQEQILRVCGEIGGFDHVHRATIRKIISKKLGEQEFNRWWKEFWKGAKERGLEKEEAKDIWNACITAGSYAFNVAHATGYGMLAWWTMYLKRHYPGEFFCACLASYDNKKRLELLRDAVRHGLKVSPPEPSTSDGTWRYVPALGTLVAGFEQIPGVGEIVSNKFLDHRDSLVRNADFAVDLAWEDYLPIRGIGAKTIEKIKAFCEMDDPFEIFKLGRAVEAVKAAIMYGELRRSGIPLPRQTSIEIPYARGVKSDVVWCGVIVKRNLKELFELHYSRTGEDLDPETVKDPDLNEWVVMWGDDGTDMLTITVNRWRYPQMREAIWQMRLGIDMVVIKGYKPSFLSRRAIQVTDMWILNGDDEEEEEALADM